MNIKFDLQAENFDEYFAFQAKLLTQGQKERLPRELISKIFRKSGKVTNTNIPILQKLYVLTKAAGKEVFIVINDEHKGINISDFERLTKKVEGRQYEVEDAEYFLSRGTMVLGSRELIDWISFLNKLSTSAAYNYALKLKNTHESKVIDKKKELSYFVNILMNYESNKKKISAYKNISVPELYVLYYLFDEKERGATKAYETIFKDSYNSSRAQILNAFKRLVQENYIQKFGTGRLITYKITALGKSIISDILKKYVLI